MEKMEKLLDKILKRIHDENKRTRELIHDENEATRKQVAEVKEMMLKFQSEDTDTATEMADDDDDATAVGNNATAVVNNATAVGNNAAAAGNQEYVIDNNNFVPLEFLGGGNGCLVHKVCKSTNSNQIFAKKEFFCSMIETDLMREIYLLREAEHDNIIKLVEVYNNAGSVTLIMEFHPHSLKDKIDRQENSEADNKSWLKQLLQGLSYLHSRGIIHRDIKPENLLISEQNILKLGDFGLARGFLDRNLTAKVGTLPYRAPENLLGARYGKPADIWAVGCIVFEMAEGKVLFGKANSDEEVISNIHRILEKLKEQSLTSKLDDKGHDLLKKLLDFDPKTRITADEALHHAYLADSGT